MKPHPLLVHGSRTVHDQRRGRSDIGNSVTFIYHLGRSMDNGRKTGNPPPRSVGVLW